MANAHALSEVFPAAIRMQTVVEYLPSMLRVKQANAIFYGHRFAAVLYLRLSP